MKNILFVLALILLSSCRDHYKWMSIGDSITYQDGEKYTLQPEKGNKAIGYQTNWINAQDTIVNLDNQGYSGYSLSGHERSVFQKVINKDFSKEDLITIAVGTNDFKLNRPIHDKNDSLNSFRYCYITLVDSILSQNKKRNLYLLTPLQRDNDKYDVNYINKAGHKLLDYRNEIIRIGKLKNIPVIDLYYDSGIDSTNFSKYTLDSLHPNNVGYKKIGKVLIDKIKIK
ncbi:SGNH/GDSL hydrolase family protein [Empedobacter tilapiae]